MTSVTTIGRYIIIQQTSENEFLNLLGIRPVSIVGPMHSGQEIVAGPTFFRGELRRLLNDIEDYEPDNHFEEGELNGLREAIRAVGLPCDLGELVDLIYAFEDWPRAELPEPCYQFQMEEGEDGYKQVEHEPNPDNAGIPYYHHSVHEILRICLYDRGGNMDEAYGSALIRIVQRAVGDGLPLVLDTDKSDQFRGDYF